MQAKQRGSALRSRAPRRFGCQRGGCGRIPLQRTSPRRKIAPNHRESGECRIRAVRAHVGMRVEEVAKVLGVSRRTLFEKMRKLNIRSDV